MAEAKKDEGDPYLREVMEAFHGQMVSPGGAAALLGVSRKTVHTLSVRGRVRSFVGPEASRLAPLVKSGPKWVYIPMVDLARYAESVGRPFPKGSYADPAEWRDRGDKPVAT